MQKQVRFREKNPMCLLLLREHRPLYEALCAVLEAGGSVGSAIEAIEAEVSTSYGRNGELPGETRRRKLEAVQGSAGGPGPLRTESPAERRVEQRPNLDDRKAVLAERLSNVKARLSELDP